MKWRGLVEGSVLIFKLEGLRKTQNLSQYTVSDLADIHTKEFPSKKQDLKDSDNGVKHSKSPGLSRILNHYKTQPFRN